MELKIEVELFAAFIAKGDVVAALLSLFSRSIYRKVRGINSNNTIYSKLQLLSLVATVLYLPSKLNTIG